MIDFQLPRTLGLVSLLSVLACSSGVAPEGGSGGSGAGAGTSGASASGASGGSAGGSGGAGSQGGAGMVTGGAAGASGAGGRAGESGAGGAAAGGAAGAAGPSGAGVGGNAAGAGGGGGDSGTFTLTSPDLAEGSLFADEYTCAEAGFNGSVAPELKWTAGPAATKSYAITFIDVTLTERATPDDNGYHWVIYDIPASTLGLPEAFKDAASIGASQNREYLGPCPNFLGGGDTHTYEFKIYALAVDKLALSPSTGTAAVKDAEAKLEASHLTQATLSGTSNASPP